MKPIHLSNTSWTLELSEHGHLIALRKGDTEIVSRSISPIICEVLTGRPEKTIAVTSARLLKHSASTAEFESILDMEKELKLRFAYNVGEADKHGTPVTCTVELASDHMLDTDLSLRWFWSSRLPAQETTVFAPLFDGRGLRTSGTKLHAWHYICSGGWGEEQSERLAIPLLQEASSESRLRIAYFADPFFSTGIILPADGSPIILHCRFLKDAGSQQFQERTFGMYLHSGDEDTALHGYFRHALPDCPPGPEWLHDIAMVHYDYLSERGEGWYRDIDKLVEHIIPGDRQRVVLILHGWYDFLGRYCYDESAGRLDARWTAMQKENRIPVSLDDMHRRIAYAKERGFRVLLYYADGLAIDSSAPNYDEQTIFREPDAQLRKHYWNGPDTVGQMYIMNPIHPRVHRFFRGYTQALLAEFGGEIDGLAWDETFTIRAGDLSTGEHAGYADRTFMLLCKELRNMVKARNHDLAFLASDCTGLALPLEDGSYRTTDPAQNALVFDGTYQDSQCYPAAWQYGIFPNYRNVLWSCNWNPVKNFEWTALGVKTFGAPVAISNGWGENKGINQYSEQEIQKVMELFQLRKEQRSRVRWIAVVDN